MKKNCASIFLNDARNCNCLKSELVIDGLVHFFRRRRGDTVHTSFLSYYHFFIFIKFLWNNFFQTYSTIGYEQIINLLTVNRNKKEQQTN